MSTETPAKVRTDALVGYLGDHQAGALGGEDLAKSLAERNTQYPALSEIAKDIADDRETLERLMQRFDSEGSIMKQAGAMTIGKLAESVFGAASDSEKSLKFLRQIEVLKMGVEGKLCLWETLQEIENTDERLGGYDFERLAGRAKSQIQALGDVQLKLARKALLD
ncbi:MAG: hypothetical protein WD602_05935 [Actinomycetota bacterium]